MKSAGESDSNEFGGGVLTGTTGVRNGVVVGKAVPGVMSGEYGYWAPRLHCGGTTTQTGFDIERMRGKRLSMTRLRVRCAGDYS